MYGPNNVLKNSLGPLNINDLSFCWLEFIFVGISFLVSTFLNIILFLEFKITSPLPFIFWIAFFLPSLKIVTSSLPGNLTCIKSFSLSLDMSGDSSSLIPKLFLSCLTFNNCNPFPIAGVIIAPPNAPPSACWLLVLIKLCSST